MSPLKAAADERVSYLCSLPLYVYVDSGVDRELMDNNARRTPDMSEQQICMHATLLIDTYILVFWLDIRSPHQQVELVLNKCQ
jgi:hypothetical protein